MLAPRRSLAVQRCAPMFELEPFDYSAAEWSEIEASVNAVRGAPISQDEGTRLLTLADQYRASFELRRLFPQFSTTKQKEELFAKAAKLCGELRSILRTAAAIRCIEGYYRMPTIAEIKDACDEIYKTGSSNGPSPSADLVPIMVASEYLTAALVANLLRPDAVPQNFTIDNATRILRAGQILDLLNELQAALDLTAKNCWGVKLTHSFSGRLDASVVYLQGVLFLWKETFGGRLAISRSPKNPKKLKGPLVRYVLAVVRPVMGHDTPSLQSLPDIVDRQKNFDHWWTAAQKRAQSNDPKAEENYVKEIEGRHPKLAVWAKRLSEITRATVNGEVKES
jgi:hypothetical protein